MAEKIRKAALKVKKVNHGKWRDLSTGEKVLKVVLWLIKLALVCVFGLVALAIFLGIVVATGIMGGLTDAVNGQIQRSNDYRHRNRPYY